MAQDDQGQSQELAQKSHAEAIQEALKSDRIPHIYANGFINASGNADMIILLQRNSNPVALLNMSYTTAKTFAEKLSQLVKNFETITEHNIMTIETVDKSLKGSK